MGVEARIVLYADNRAIGHQAAAEAIEMLHATDEALSDWLVGGEVARLREASPHQHIPLSPQLHEALTIALYWADRTGYAFDPACGRMTRQWREARLDQSTPRSWKAWVAQHGSPSTRIHITSSGLQFERPVPWIDFGGIGKGIGVDAALQVLTKAGCPSAMVQLGGDIALGAAPPGRDGWRIGIGERGSSIVLEHGGVSTSGARFQHIKRDDDFSSHLFNPRTGVWMTHEHEITVVAPTATAADALATAGSVLDPVQFCELVKSIPDVKVYGQAAIQDCQP